MWYNLLNSAQTAQEKRKGYSMKIVLVGGGKVGTALARQLSEEGHNVTVIDTNKARVEHIGESYDVMSILGNGSSITTLSEAGVEEADVFIAVTGSDELNLLCCMFAKKAGHCHAIARVRNPSYSHERTSSKSRSAFRPSSIRKWLQQRRSPICCASRAQVRSTPLQTAVCG